VISKTCFTKSIPRSGEDNDGQLTKRNPGKLKRWGARGKIAPVIVNTAQNRT
ncbi:unnamed protein product, partial [Heterotrigona itama]